MSPYVNQVQTQTTGLSAGTDHIDNLSLPQKIPIRQIRRTDPWAIRFYTAANSPTKPMGQDKAKLSSCAANLNEQPITRKARIQEQ